MTGAPTKQETKIREKIRQELKELSETLPQRAFYSLARRGQLPLMSPEESSREFKKVRTLAKQVRNKLQAH